MDLMLTKHKNGRIWHVTGFDNSFETLCGKKTSGWEFIDIPFEDLKICSSCKSLIKKEKNYDEPVKAIKRDNPHQTW